MNLLWIGKTGKANAWYHITLTASAETVNNLYVVRHEPPVREVKSDKVTYHTFKEKGRLPYIFRMFWAGVRLLRKKEVDTIITFNVFPYGFLAYLLSVLFNKKLVLCFIGADFNSYFKKKPYRSLITKSLKSANVVICKGHHMTSDLIAAGIEPSKIDYYPHFVSDEYFINDDSDKDFDVINVCEFINRKRVDILIKAIAELKSENIYVRICLVGEGELREELEQLSLDLGVSDLITFAGFQKNTIPYLSKSKIFVQTSVGEGLSLSLMEAMASGLVPIVTEAGSERDIIRDGENGLFIEMNDTTSLVEALKKALNADNYDNMKSVIMNERQKYTLKNASASMSEILKQLKDI